MRPALHPDGRRIAVGLPLMPTFAHDGESVYCVEADEEQRFHLMKVATAGGEPRDVSPTVWDWGEPAARVEVRTRLEGKPSFAPARISVQDGSGHPVLPGC